ncbi:hypothetical protein [Halopiger goleimassiliensis]|uniref:hypothetical protein n=1 Tax=Halopiger goleimassiliensis TaxID=1293048 RepID=UPI000677BDC7|nr:hypothetical protein [Halopiger goleimassiliensis]
MKRRELIALVGATTTSGIAGCTSGSNEDTPSNDDDDPSNDDGTDDENDDSAPANGETGAEDDSENTEADDDSDENEDVDIEAILQAADFEDDGWTQVDRQIDADYGFRELTRGETERLQVVVVIFPSEDEARAEFEYWYPADSSDLDVADQTGAYEHPPEEGSPGEVELSFRDGEVMVTLIHTDETDGDVEVVESYATEIYENWAE